MIDQIFCDHFPENKPAIDPDNQPENPFTSEFIDTYYNLGIICQDKEDPKKTNYYNRPALVQFRITNVGNFDKKLQDDIRSHENLK